ncbi:MAG: tripartite tricarboxylate transporter TctB family protein, partial [Halomonas sp.]|nr:tripartite tricarboxylate transporter TctB family protein [Halomonas sp.]
MTKTGSALIKDPWDVVTGVGMLGFSLLLLIYLVPNYIGQPPIMQNPMMSPRWLPNIVGWLLLVFSVLLILQGFLVADNAE